MKKLGGPKAITNFAGSIGNKTFNLAHYEGNLNSNPKDKDDTSTPKDMAISVEKLTLGNILAKPQRTQLVTWMRNNTTGYKRIRAGVPIGWVVADKTGSGSYGIANDIDREMLILTFKTTQHDRLRRVTPLTKSVIMKRVTVWDKI